ncbi:MAG: deoxynucleoside kinase [Clostridiales bacterium]|nr:deoxynucleoside kinase [Clostridiales bacterium]
MYISCDRKNYKEGLDHNMSIIVDGIIGAGKTTVGKFLSDEYQLEFYEELKSDDNVSLVQRMLDRFYADPNRWSAIVQTMFLSDRFKDMKTVQVLKKRSVFDRSIYGDEIFAKTIHYRGQMTDDEFLIYQKVLKNMLAFIKPPELLIYIDVSIDTAMERINKRARSTEADLIPRDYMEDLKKHYDEWFNAFDLCPKLKLNLNDSMLESNGSINKDMGKYILDRINSILK